MTALGTLNIVEYILLGAMVYILMRMCVEVFLFYLKRKD